MAKRVSTSIADGIYDLLQEWANEERRSISGLSAFLLEQAVRERQKQKQPQSSDEKQEKS
ncbi:ribbon-helix-helix domain-containing protein [Microcoleus sp. herbarium12]|uniref:ribbon-helix-helix domain-containing protein n=1 Tax=Microcoleus sp. herbarium12 TaxID=3055437 RepID=UPI002FD08B41